jgi:hypothetical protein
MGWWTQNEQGHSFATAAGAEMVWGDSVADILDGAIAEIADEFEQQYNRRPTKDEVRAGLEFSLGGKEEV